MSAFSDISRLEILQIWDGVTGRAVAGSEATFAYIELEPGTVVPEHRHPSEQTGLLLRGSLRFTIGDETKELAPGAMWVIPGDVTHRVEAGPEGAALAELFAPPRDDWAGLQRSPASPVTLP
ncbi:MAG TPA: cupin domain-containing protein [Gaiellaceae bacterium]